MPPDYRYGFSRNRTVYVHDGPQIIFFSSGTSRDRVVILKYFRQQFATNWHFCSEYNYFFKIWIITLVFNKNAIFFAEKWRK
jgi:hypothetical protein